MLKLFLFAIGNYRNQRPALYFAGERLRDPVPTDATGAG